MAVRALSITGLLFACFLFGTPGVYAWVTRWMLRILDIRGGFASKWDEARLQVFCRHTGPALIVFNHPTWYDFAVIMSTFGRRIVPRFVAFRWSIPFPLNRMAEAMQCLLLEKAHGTGMAAHIARTVQSRRPGEPIVCIAPAGPHSCEDETRLPPFRTSAFLADVPILPVVLRYQPYHGWNEGLSLGACVWKLLACQTPIRYRVHVLPLQMRWGHETVEAFKQRVKDEMESVPRMLEPWPDSESDTPECEPAYRGSWLLLLTSFAMAVPGWHALMHPPPCKTLYGLGMLATALTSSLYHATGNRHMHAIDNACVYTSAVFFGALCWADGYGLPLTALGALSMLRLLFPWRLPIGHALRIVGFTALAAVRECPLSQAWLLR